MRSLATLTVLAATALSPGATAADAADVTAAVRSSLVFLQDEGDRWLRGEVPVQKGSACVSCHHGGFAVWTLHEAERAGIVEPSAAGEDLRRRAMELDARPGEARIVSATQLIMADAHGEADLELMRSDGNPDGTWRARGQFPTQLRSEEESDAVATLWAIAALQSLELPDPPSAARLDGALEWLAGADPGVSTEWTVARLVVAHRRGETRRAATLVDRLLATQHEDGGWSWLAEAPSNPYSTGQTVYALAIVGDARAQEALDRGVDYLLATQEADGTWATPSRLTSAEPSAGKDVIYRYWGTAWASLGLTRTLDTP